MPNDNEELKLVVQYDPKAVQQSTKDMDNAEKQATKTAAAMQKVGDQAEVAGKKVQVLTRQYSESANKRLVESFERKVAGIGSSPLEQFQKDAKSKLDRVSGDTALAARLNAAAIEGENRYREVINKTALAKAESAQKEVLLANARTASAQANQQARAFEQAEVKLSAEKVLRQKEEQALLDKFTRSQTTANEQRAASAAKAIRVENEEFAALKLKSELAGKSKAQQLGIERDNLLSTLSANSPRVQEAKAYYSALIKVAEAEEAERLASGHGGLFSRSTASGRAFLGAKDLLEGRTSYAEVEFGTAASKLGGPALIGAVGVATIVGATTAIIKMIDALKSVGIEQKELQTRTGLSTQEITTFEFAAKRVGSSLDETSGLMKGLTRDLTEGGEAGRKATTAFKELNIAPYDISGKLKPTGELLLEISDAFAKLPPGINLSASAIDLFSRYGEKSLPFLRELRSNSEYAAEHGLTGLTQKEVDEWSELGKNIDVASAKFKLFADRGIAAVLKGLANPSGGGGIGALRQIGADNDALDKSQAILRERVKAVEDGAARFKAVQEAGGEAEVTSAQKRLNAYLTSSDAILAAQDKVNAAKTKYEAEITKAGNLALGIISPAVANSEISLIGKLRSDTESAQERLRTLQEQQSIREGALREFTDQRRIANTKLAETQVAVAAAADYNGKVEISAVSKVIAAYKEEIATKQKLAGPLGLPAAALTEARGVYSTNLITAALEDQAKLGEAARKTQAAIDENNDKLSQERFKKEREFRDKTHELNIQTAQTELDYQETAAEQLRDRQLRGIQNLDAKTLDQKVAFEVKKGEIEAQFAATSYQLRLNSIESERQAAVTAAESEVSDYVDLAIRRGAIDDRALVLRKQAELTADDAINKYREEAGIKAAEAVRDANTKVFDTFKRESEGVFDSLLNKSKSFGDAIGGLFKNIFVTAAKDIVSTQSARYLTELFTGEKVGLTPANPASGAFGKIGQALGLGARPTFQSKLDQAGHLGDLALVSGTVPVTIVNAGALGGGGNTTNVTVAGRATNQFSNTITNLLRGPAAASGVLALALSGAGAAGGGGFGGGGVGGGVSGGGGFGSGGGGTGIEQVQSTLSFPDQGTSQTYSPVNRLTGFSSLANVQIPGLNLDGGAFESGGGGGVGSSGGGGGLPGILRSITGGGGGGTKLGGGGGFVNSLKGFATGGGLNNLIGGLFLSAGLKGSPYKASSAINTGLGGAILGSSLGSLIGFGLEGGAEFGGGLALATAGIRRGGKAGLGLSIGGGALAGAALGTLILPGIGTLIGAGIGAAAGAIGSLIRHFVKPKSEQVHDKIRDLYGVEIKDKGVLQSIVDIANSKFGGYVDAAVRSQEARQIVQLYAISTGQPAKGILATPQASVFANINGKLTEQPTYFNGQAVYPGQTQSSIGLPVLTPLGYQYTTPPGGANVTHLQLDADATTAFLQGQAVQTIQSNSRLVSGAASAGTQAASTQRSNGVGILNPTLLTA